MKLLHHSYSTNGVRPPAPPNGGRLIGFACAALVLAAGGMAHAALPERVAIVYSDWGKSAFANEYDKHLKRQGWAFDKYENIRLPELSGKLGRYNLVIAASVANYTQTVKMAPFAEAWRKWLADGGTLIVTDANYGSVLGNWVAAFGPGFESGCALCSAHTKPSDATRAVAVRPDPLLACPQPLGDLFQKHYRQWTHLTKLGPDWHTPITCVDGAPLFAYRRFGKGLVVLTSAASLRNSPIASALLENVAADRRLREKGIEVLSFEPNLPGGSPAERVSRLRLKFAPGGARKVTATLAARNGRAKGKAEAKAVEEAAVPPSGEVTLAPACALVRNGVVASRLEVALDGETIFSCSWEETLPDVLSIKFKRKHLYPGDAVLPQVTICPPAEGRGQLTGVAWRIDGGEWHERAAQDGTWTIPATGLPFARHVLQARLVYHDGFLASMEKGRRELYDWGEAVEVEFFTHPEPKYRMRGDHVLLENGQPFFPLGFYDVSWAIPAAERLAMAQDVAKWGYNTVHVGMRGDEYECDGYGAFLDACAKLGVRVITEFNVNKAESVIRKYRGKAAVLGWNPGDEPAPKGITPAQMFARYDRFKQLDPDHLAYTVICVPSQYANYAAGTDVLAPDPYPVPKRGVDVVYRRFKEAKEAANKVDTALWAVGQAFGGQKYDKKGAWPRWPDAREFRGMSYLALMAGAKGIIYYTYYDGSFDIRKAPDLLEAVKAFPAELRELVPFVLDGKGELLAENTDGVYAMAWTRGTERRLVVVNARDKEAEVSLPFAGGRVLFGAPRNLRTDGGRIRFTIPPLERVVIK